MTAGAVEEATLMLHLNDGSILDIGRFWGPNWNTPLPAYIKRSQKPIRQWWFQNSSCIFLLWCLWYLLLRLTKFWLHMNPKIFCCRCFNQQLVLLLLVEKLCLPIIRCFVYFIAIRRCLVICMQNSLKWSPSLNPD